jgi:hypothetical protein
VRHEKDGDDDSHNGQQIRRNLGAKGIGISHSEANLRRQPRPVKLDAGENLCVILPAVSQAPPCSPTGALDRPPLRRLQSIYNGLGWLALAEKRGTPEIYFTFFFAFFQFFGIFRTASHCASKTSVAWNPPQKIIPKNLR